MGLSDFDLANHSGALLDGIADAFFLHKHREVLQGRAKVSKEGKSATMKFAYPFTFCRRAVVATFDLAAKNLHMFQHHHWLRNPRNVMQLWLTGPSWVGPDRLVTLGGARDPARVQEMEAWGVASLARSLAVADLEGPAGVLRANGVRGMDLCQMSAADIEEELGLSRFAARRVCRWRDEFLGGGTE